MQYRVKVLQQGSYWDVTWEPGKVECEPIVAELLKDWSVGSTHGPQGGPYFSGDAIFNDAWAFYLMLYENSEDVEIVAGELPERPPLPRGAIG